MKIRHVQVKGPAYISISLTHTNTHRTGPLKLSYVIAAATVSGSNCKLEVTNKVRQRRLPHSIYQFAAPITLLSSILSIDRCWFQLHHHHPHLLSRLVILLHLNSSFPNSVFTNFLPLFALLISSPSLFLFLFPFEKLKQLASLLN